MPGKTRRPVAEELPTVFALCQPCSAVDSHNVASRYFGKAFTPRQMDRKPVCDNCEGEMTVLYTVRGVR